MIHTCQYPYDMDTEMHDLEMDVEFFLDSFCPQKFNGSTQYSTDKPDIYGSSRKTACFLNRNAMAIEG